MELVSVRPIAIYPPSPIESNSILNLFRVALALSPRPTATDVAFAHSLFVFFVCHLFLIQPCVGDAELGPKRRTVPSAQQWVRAPGPVWAGRGFGISFGCEDKGVGPKTHGIGDPHFARAGGGVVQRSHCGRRGEPTESGTWHDHVTGLSQGPGT